jgi:hypothetical protein
MLAGRFPTPKRGWLLVRHEDLPIWHPRQVMESIPSSRMPIMAVVGVPVGCFARRCSVSPEDKVGTPCSASTQRARNRLRPLLRWRSPWQPRVSWLRLSCPGAELRSSAALGCRRMLCSRSAEGERLCPFNELVLGGVARESRSPGGLYPYPGT